MCDAVATHLPRPFDFGAGSRPLRWLGLPPLNVSCSANIDRKGGLREGSEAALGLSAAAAAAVEAQHSLDVELHDLAQHIFERRWQA